jgi:hypothetical protein
MENDGYEKIGEGEDAVYRKSFATGVTASNETPAPKKAAVKPMMAEDYDRGETARRTAQRPMMAEDYDRGETARRTAQSPARANASSESKSDKKPEPLSNAEKLALGSAATGSAAVAAGLARAGINSLAGRRAGIIEKVIGKFTSKNSKTPEPIRSPSANAKPETPLQKSTSEKQTELASSAAKEKARSTGDTKFGYQTDKIKIPERKLSTTLAERNEAVKARSTGDTKFGYQTDKIKIPKKTLPDTLATRTAAMLERQRSKARGGKIVRMASGGFVSAASSRADGIAQRGKTKFRIY